MRYLQRLLLAVSLAAILSHTLRASEDLFCGDCHEAQRPTRQSNPKFRADYFAPGRVKAEGIVTKSRWGYVHTNKLYGTEYDKPGSSQYCFVAKRHWPEIAGYHLGWSWTELLDCYDMKPFKIVEPDASKEGKR